MEQFSLIIFLIFLLTFTGCESPQKFDWEKFLTGTDSDIVLNDEDSDNKGDAVDDDDNGDDDNGDDDNGDDDNGDDDKGDDDKGDDDNGDDDNGDDNSGDDRTGDDDNNGDDGDAAVPDGSDEDSEKTPDEDITPSICGNEIVEEGEICDGGVKSCHDLGVGTEGTVSCNSGCDGWDTTGICKRTFECVSKPGGDTTVWNSVTSYEQTWDVTSWNPVDSSAKFNEISSTTSCRYKCAQGYLWNGLNCVTDSRSGRVCSGQTKCFDNTNEVLCSTAVYGQDAHFLNKCFDRSYTVSGAPGDEVVTDNNTGLVWQRASLTNYPGCSGGDPAGSSCLWQEAVDYCKNLNYGGKSDWRLPKIKELATLIDYGRAYPAIDNSVFTVATSSASTYFWTSSTNASQADQAASVDFWQGKVVFGTYKSNSLHARCVRGGEIDKHSNFIESEVAGKTIVTDTSTGLVWQKEYSSSVTWVNALNYCESSTYANFTDWRLPNISELTTLMDDRFYGPVSSFPEISDQTLWSSTTSFSVTHAWRVSFTNGYVHYHNKTYDGLARCVRGDLL